ncbi:MAG: efflux RND transporter periplasmic adaptor subunit [Opitutales bacterium]
MKRKANPVRWILLLLVIIGAPAGWWSFRQADDTLVAVTLGEATRGNITSVVTATGKIFPEVEVRISSEVPGEIVELPVTEGQTVQKGDLLVRVNTDTLQAQAKQQEASLSAARANAAQSRAQLLQAELDLKRIEGLFASDFATEDQLDQARTALEVRRAAHEAAVFRIEQQEMQVEEARDQLDRASTYAPIDGTISSLNSELGDRVVGTGQFEGTEIMRLADLSHMEVRVDVSEADIVEVKTGDEADIEIDALPGETFSGVVSEIASSAVTSNQGSSDQLTTFAVKVRLTRPNARIRPGMTATADIKTRTVRDVVRVPLQSVTVRPRAAVNEVLGVVEKPPRDRPTRAEGDNRDGGEHGGRGRGSDNLTRIVFVAEGGESVSMVRVQTGIADSRFIEITEGLEAGQPVVTGPYGAITRDLEHQSAITVEETARRWNRD